MITKRRMDGLYLYIEDNCLLKVCEVYKVYKVYKVYHSRSTAPPVERLRYDAGAS